MNERLDQIEIKIAFLEQANVQLSDVVYQQRQQIEALKARLAGIADRFAAAQTQPTAYTLDDEKPPHY